VKKIWIILGVIFGIIIILVIINSLGPTEEEIQIKEEKANAEKLRIYNEEHKEEHYQKGLELLKENKLEEALAMFKRVVAVDEGYKDTQAQTQKINDTLAALRKEKEIADAKQMIEEAKKLSKSNNCGDLNRAINLFKNALRVFPDSKEIKSYLQAAQIKELGCSEGNNEIQMAIQIVNYQPLTLHVWIENKSNKVRHANPNYFTLVTVKNMSLSHSTKTYEYSGYFDAVDLQPGTTTSGIIVFDTYDKPKKIVYRELLGTTISREFPFN